MADCSGGLLSCNRSSRSKYREELTTFSVAAVYDRRLYFSGFEARGIKPAVIDRRYRRNHPTRCAALKEIVHSLLIQDTMTSMTAGFSVDSPKMALRAG